MKRQSLVVDLEKDDWHDGIFMFTVRWLLKEMRRTDLIGHDWNQQWHIFLLSVPPTLPLHHAVLQMCLFVSTK